MFMANNTIKGVLLSTLFENHPAALESPSDLSGGQKKSQLPKEAGHFIIPKDVVVLSYLCSELFLVALNQFLHDFVDLLIVQGFFCILKNKAHGV